MKKKLYRNVVLSLIILLLVIIFTSCKVDKRVYEKAKIVDFQRYNIIKEMGIAGKTDTIYVYSIIYLKDSTVSDYATKMKLSKGDIVRVY